MKILVIGAKGFFGKNLVENLKTVRDGKNRTRPDLHIEQIYEYDLDSTWEQLEQYCTDCDFVFNLTGVDCPQKTPELEPDDFEFACKLIETLKKHHNTCPIMVSSSVYTLLGRYNNACGQPENAGEKLFFDYAQESGVRVLVYRFPNLVGKWVRPNDNSVVGTFCHHIANDLPITVKDPNEELELLFIDDLIHEMFDALEGKEHHCTFDGTTTVLDKNGAYCIVPTTHKVTLGYVAECLYQFHDHPQTLLLPSIPNGSFEKKLYSMYVSYLPKSKIAFDLEMNCDDRGSFTEILKTLDHGQFSVNISKHGVTKGQHWHNSKWEFFVVVSGHGLIQERKTGTDEVIEFEVSGEHLKAVYMLPGYTHNIRNLSDTENLVTLMWANEIFDSNHPDTFHGEV